MYCLVFPCIALYSQLLPCIAIYYHVLPCMPMYCHVLLCIAMHYHVMPWKIGWVYKFWVFFSEFYGILLTWDYRKSYFQISDLFLQSCILWIYGRVSDEIFAGLVVLNFLIKNYYKSFQIKTFWMDVFLKYSLFFTHVRMPIWI